MVFSKPRPADFPFKLRHPLRSSLPGQERVGTLTPPLIGCKSYMAGRRPVHKSCRARRCRGRRRRLPGLLEPPFSRWHGNHSPEMREMREKARVSALFLLQWSMGLFSKRGDEPGGLNYSRAPRKREASEGAERRQASSPPPRLASTGIMHVFHV